MRKLKEERNEEIEKPDFSLKNLEITQVKRILYLEMNSRKMAALPIRVNQVLVLLP